eukprot:430680_1
MGCGSSKNKSPKRNIRHADPAPYDLSSFNSYTLPDHPTQHATENNTFRLITDEARKIYNPVGLTKSLTIPSGLKGIVVSKTKDIKDPIDTLNIANPDGTYSRVWWKHVSDKVWQGDTFQTVKFKNYPNVKLKGAGDRSETHLSVFRHKYQILVQFDNIYEGCYVWVDYDITSLYDTNNLTSTQWERHCQQVMNEFLVDQMNVNAVQSEEKMSQRYTKYHKLTTVGVCFCYQNPSDTWDDRNGFLDENSVVWLVAPELSHVFPSDKRIFVYIPDAKIILSKRKMYNGKFAWIDKKLTNLLRDFWLENDEENIIIGKDANTGYRNAMIYLEGHQGYYNKLELEPGFLVQLLSRTWFNHHTRVKVKILQGNAKYPFSGSVQGQIVFMHPGNIKWLSKTDFMKKENVDLRFSVIL